jgi:hypothetical protein
MIKLSFSTGSASDPLPYCKALLPDGDEKTAQFRGALD